MSSPALALVPLPHAACTGTGATTGSVSQGGHRYHALRENTDGKQERREAGRFAAPHWPGVPCFPLSTHPARSCP